MTVSCPRCGHTLWAQEVHVRTISLRDLFCPSCRLQWSEVHEVQRIRYLMPRLLRKSGQWLCSGEEFKRAWNTLHALMKGARRG